MKKLSKIGLVVLSFVLLFNIALADVVDIWDPAPRHFYEEEFTVSHVILFIVSIVVAVSICALVYWGIVKKGQKTPENGQTVESSKEDQK